MTESFFENCISNITAYAIALEEAERKKREIENLYKLCEKHSGYADIHLEVSDKRFDLSINSSDYEDMFDNVLLNLKDACDADINYNKSQKLFWIGKLKEDIEITKE